MADFTVNLSAFSMDDLQDALEVLQQSTTPNVQAPLFARLYVALRTEIETRSMP